MSRPDATIRRVSTGSVLTSAQVILSVLLLLALAATTANAQVLSGTLTGTVVDSTNAVVPNAKVVVKDLGTGKEYQETTDAVGVFTVTNLANGLFSVTVEHPGFSKTVIEQVQIFVSQTSKVTVKLEVAKTGTEVIVQAEQAAVQTESIELKNTVERKQIMDLPLPTRNPLDLVKTFAGIISPNSSTLGDSYVHGLRGNMTNLTQDGINVADNFVKTSAFFAISAPIVDTIGEMNVSVGGIGADAGFGAAQVSMITQRGTNSFHGEAYWYQRTNELNANTWFNNQAGVARPFQLQNRLGASAGGPVVLPKIYNGKNRTFVFGAYEAYREPLSRFRERTVLTDTARTGQFTYTPPGGSLQTVNLLSLGTLGNAAGPAVINQNVMSVYNKYVPASGLTDAGCGSGDTRNIRCFAFNLPGKGIQDRYTLRIDHQLTQKHALQFVWNQADYSSIPDLLNGIEPQFPGSPGGGQLSRRQVFVWAFTSVFTPNLTNEARVGYQRAPVQFAYPNTFSDTGGFQINTAGVLANPVLTSTNLPQGRNTPVRQVIDNVAWVHGNHQIRFGGEYRLQLANSFVFNSVIPNVNLGSNSANPDGLSAGSFPGGISTSDLVRAQTIFDTITGLYGSVQQGFNHTSPTSGYVPRVPESYNPIQQNFAWYLQDSWKMRRNFTVQYGVRWEYAGPYNERSGLLLLPQDGIAGVFGPTPVGGFFNPGNTTGATDSLLTLQGASNGHPVAKRDLNNFAPFLGIAWDPFGDGKTSIRASFATHFSQDGFTAFTPATTTNAGLFFAPTNSVPTGVYNPAAVPGPATPVSVFPVSQIANFALSTGAQSEIAFNPNLATPYVFEWSIGIQRELWKKWAIDARYVGNHSVKEYRTWNANEVDLNQNGLLTEYLHAQNNYNINQANGVKGTFASQGAPGQVPTPIFDTIFKGVSAGSGYGNSGFISNITQNTVGTMFGTIRRSPVYAKNITSLPLNFFVANPWANSALVVDNSGWSKFDGLEVEVSRRFSSFFMQATYTFSKVMADSTFSNSQTEGQNYQSVINRGLDKFRSGIDTTHSFAMNFLYPLPLGRGKRFLNSAPKVVNMLVGGWSLNGFTRWSTGAPFSILSRVTTGSLLTSTANIQNLTERQLQKDIGTFRGPNGIYWLDPKSGLLNVKGASSTPVFCTAGQTTPCFSVPAPGQIGNTGYNFFSGPHFFNQDFSLIKETTIFERIKFQIRLEAFDAFNNANFQGLTNTVDSQTFGQMTGTVDTTRSGGVNARTVQWAAKVTF